MDYAIGDIHGCYDQLMQLLDHIQFDDTNDRLWFSGDFVNRGPDALAVLRFVSSLKTKPMVVLGNHDIHFLAVFYGVQKVHPKFDNFDDLFKAFDIGELAEWLAQQRLAIYDQSLDVLLTHAGICPSWSLSKALRYAKEVEQVLSDPKQRLDYLSIIYGNEPSVWSEQLQGGARLRLITNYLTRMRYLDKTNHRLLLQYNTLTSDKQAVPWFECIEPQPNNRLLLFGHWAALKGQVNRQDIIGLDTGCYYGGVLTAVELVSRTKYQV